MRLDGQFINVGRDELGKGCKFGFFFLASSIEGDTDIWIWGVSSCVASNFEACFEGFVIIWGSITWAPPASVWSSFFVKNSESVPDGGWYFKNKMVVFLVETPPLKCFEIEIDWAEDSRVVWISSVIAFSQSSGF